MTLIRQYSVDEEVIIYSARGKLQMQKFQLCHLNYDALL